MDIVILDEAKRVWDKINQSGAALDLTFQLEVHRKMLEFFHIGNFYYYLFDVKNACFKYVSSDIYKVLGYDAEKVDFNFFLSKIHPADQKILLNNEKAIVDFFAKLPNDKISKYKVSYDYRVRNNRDEYIRILQQWIIVQFNDEENLVTTLGVHTDITHLKKNNVSTLSFLGLDGEPSYIDVNVKNIYRKDAEVFTKREKEILHLITQGEPTTAIAKKLFISVHTVNTHRKNILAKTKTKNIIELCVKVINEGLL